MTSNFMEIDRELEQDSALGARTHLLSISVDPAFDRPGVLRRYGEGHGLKDFKRWEYATGSEGEVRKMAEYFGLQYKKEGGQIIHSLRTAVIGPDGRLVKVYRANEWKPSEVLADLRNQ
jgi:protein SCO1/2